MTESQRARGVTSPFRGRVCNLLFGLLAVLAPAARAQSIPATFSKVGAEYRLTLQPDPALYFGFQHSEDLLLPWMTEALSLSGATPIIFGYTPGTGELRGFFRARGISVSAPEDQDGDLIDDIWELQHPSDLDPLDPNDAVLPSTEADALPGETNLQYYRRKRGIEGRQEAISREVALFNFGSPVHGTEALSRVISVFNGDGLPTSLLQQVYSREVTAFNFGSPLANFEAVSRQVTAFNFGSPLAQNEAISRLVSVFNGENPPDSGIQEAYSREVSAFNYGSAPHSTEAISRKISVQNTQGTPNP